MTQKIQEAVHPLLEKEISHIRSWQQWKELWGETTLAELRHSLLHFGFAVRADSQEDLVDRVCLYLDTADEWTSSGRKFYKSGENERELSWGTVFGREVDSFAKLRQILARKAFEVLCQSFFKNTNDKERGAAPSWARLACCSQVLEKLFWFFRLDESGNIPNALWYSDDHHVVIAKEFIRSICDFAWSCENSNQWYRGEIYDETKVELRKVRPDVVTLLFGLKQFDVLLDNRYELDGRCMQRIEELAMGFEVWLPSATSWQNEKRKPFTLEEACLGGSQAARMLLTLRVKQAEEVRFEEIRKLLKQRREAEEKLKKVQKGS